MRSIGTIISTKLHYQLRDSIEILGVAQSFHLGKELLYTDDFFQKATWQRSAGRGCFASYSLLRNIKWLEKLELLSLGRMSHALIGTLSPLRLSTDCSYLFYRLFAMSEALRTKIWWKAAVSLGKAAVTITTLIICAWRIQNTLCTLGLISANLMLDTYIIQQRISHV
jgi:hypothetical protein